MIGDADFSLMTAIDVLDTLAAGQTPPLPKVLRAALVLALSVTVSDDEPFQVVRDLEQLLLGTAELDAAGRYRAGSVASALRQHIGVH